MSTCLLAIGSLALFLGLVMVCVEIWGDLRTDWIALVICLMLIFWGVFNLAAGFFL